MIHPVVDPRDLGGSNAHTAHQPLGQVLADGNIAMDQRAQQAAQPLVLAVAAIEVAHIASVLAMHPLATGKQQAQHLGFQCGQVTGMDDGRTQATQGAPQAQVDGGIVARAFVQLDHLHIRHGQAPGEGLGSWSGR